MSDKLVAETSTWQHLQQKNIHAPAGIRTHDLSRRAAADLRLRPRGHWDRLAYQLMVYFNNKLEKISQLWRASLNKRRRKMLPRLSVIPFFIKCTALSRGHNTRNHFTLFPSVLFNWQLQKIRFLECLVSRHSGTRRNEKVWKIAVKSMVSFTLNQ